MAKGKQLTPPERFRAQTALREWVNSDPESNGEGFSYSELGVILARMTTIPRISFTASVTRGLFKAIEVKPSDFIRATSVLHTLHTKVADLTERVDELEDVVRRLVGKK